jgi:hypothetical protein
MSGQFLMNSFLPPLTLLHRALAQPLLLFSACRERERERRERKREREREREMPSMEERGLCEQVAEGINLRRNEGQTSR